MLRARPFIPPSSPGIELSEMRSVKVPYHGKLGGEFKSANFAVLIENGRNTVQAKFLSGDGELRAAIRNLQTIRFPQTFPDAAPAKISLQGMLSCSKYTPECTFVFLTLDTPTVFLSHPPQGN